MIKNWKDFLRELWKIIYPCVLYLFILNGVSALGMEFLGKTWHQDHRMLLSCLSMILTIPFLIWIYWKEYKEMPYFFAEKIQIGPLQYLGIGAGTFFLAWILNVLIALSKIQEVFPEYQNTVRGMYQENGFIILLAMLLLAPVMEELVFRGICYGRIRRIADKKVTIVLSALLFGIYHMNLIQFLYAFVMGLVFGAVYEKYRDLKTVIGAHFFANLCAVLLSISSLHF